MATSKLIFLKKAEELIPSGCYCYGAVNKLLENPNSYLTIKLEKLCSFWTKLDTGSGYCKYLKKSDDEIGNGMLWDQIKECGVKLEESI